MQLPTDQANKKVRRALTPYMVYSIGYKMRHRCDINVNVGAL